MGAASSRLSLNQEAQPEMTRATGEPFGGTRSDAASAAWCAGIDYFVASNVRTAGKPSSMLFWNQDECKQVAF
jgi:hypothetical protein